MLKPLVLNFHPDLFARLKYVAEKEIPAKLKPIVSVQSLAPINVASPVVKGHQCPANNHLPLISHRGFPFSGSYHMNFTSNYHMKIYFDNLI